MTDRSADLTVGQAAARLGFHPNTVYRWCSRGFVPGAWQTPGGTWRIPPEALEQLTNWRAP